MTIAAGSYTFGAGGNYATLGAALADLADTLTGNITLTQVGNSNDGSSTIGWFGSNKSLPTNGFLTINGGAAHNGSPLNGYSCIYGILEIDPDFGGGFPDPLLGGVYLNDIYGIGTTILGSGWVSRGLIRLDNCLFNGATTLQGYTPSGTLQPGRYVRASNSKFWGSLSGAEPLTLWMSGSGSEGLEVCFQLENCVMYQQHASGRSALRYTSNSPSVGQMSPNSASYIKNCVFITPNNGIPAFYFDGNPVFFPLAQFTMQYLNNARTDSTNPYGATWLYSAITSPADVISLSDTQPGFLDLNHTSALFTAGAAPALPGNPYSAPYPIGIWYAIPPTGIGGGGDEDSMQVPVPALAGQGYMRPGKSRIFPWATGRLSHARIIAAHRSPDQAAQFHNLIREGT